MTLNRMFMPVIWLLLGLALGVGLLTWRSAPTHHDIQPTTLEQLVRTAADRAGAEVAGSVSGGLEAVYAPVHAAVPAYADFHYSMLGQYTELGEAALGRMAAGMEERLFPGLADRLTAEAVRLDADYAAAFQRNLDAAIRAETPEAALHLPLGEATRLIRQDALDRARITVPVATLAAAAGPAAVRVAATALARRLGTRIAAKVGAGAAGQGAGALAGAGTGATLCSPGGPLGVAVCGAGGFVLTWFLVDYTVIRLDEHFNRDEFEADLHRLIDEDRAAMAMALDRALRDKARAIGPPAAAP